MKEAPRTDEIVSRLRSIMSAFLAGVLALVVVFAASPAGAQDDPAKAMCLAAFGATQSLRDEGKLLAAREQALTCSREQCPEVITTKCKTWQREIDESTPSIVVRVIDESGRDTADATLSIDGAPVKQRLDGLPVAVDPGEHVVRIERPGQPPKEQQVVLNVGDQAREIVVSYAPASSPVADVPARAEPNVHVLTYIGFGLAGAGVIVGAITGGLSMAKTGDLEAACPAKRCAATDESLHGEATTLSHVATAGFAVAGAGAVLGVIGLFALSDGLFGEGEVALSPVLGPGAFGVRGTF